MLEIKDKENFESLKKTITRLVGFDCSHYTDSFLERRVEVRLRVTKLNSYMEYARLLQKDEEEKEKLNKELTIHTTNFFRDASFWDIFIKEVIPTLTDLKKQTKTINIWSAGSSTGEEALSIAICFYEALGESLGGFKVKITGTDLDTDTIQKAREANYEENQFREMPNKYKEKYFDKAEGKLFAAQPLIKKIVSYKTGNIISDIKPRNIDLIFCRNTVIYFDLKAKSKLYEEFYDCLNNGGFFIMGKTEVLQGMAREKFQVFSNTERIYIKE